MREAIIGWDIGGAHLKAAVLGIDGRIISVIQQPCPLWRGLDELDAAIDAVMEEIPHRSLLYAITMTGELVDMFSGREQGVTAIIDCIVQHFSQEKIVIFAGAKGFVSPSLLSAETIAAIASANWLASATLAARKIKDCLFVDIGSTTTDIIVCSDSKANVRGKSDFERLAVEEMVYTGIVRTPVMAISQEVEFKGDRIGLMAEYFATMADVYRLTGELNEAHDQMDTADGAEKTMTASGRRLARMIGCDYEAKEHQQWQQLALNIRSRQITRLQHACERQLSRGLLDSEASFVGAGIGRFLIKELANRLGYSYIDFEAVLNQPSFDSKNSIADCAPAVSVACLARALLD